jgi:hypothetical protein
VQPVHDSDSAAASQSNSQTKPAVDRVDALREADRQVQIKEPQAEATKLREQQAEAVAEEATPAPEQRLNAAGTTAVLEARAEKTDNPDKENADTTLGALSIQQVIQKAIRDSQMQSRAGQGQYMDIMG